MKITLNNNLGTPFGTLWNTFGGLGIVFDRNDGIRRSLEFRPELLVFVCTLPLGLPEVL